MPGGNVGAQDVATGPDGNLWVTDLFHNTIVKMAPSGAVLNSYTVPTAASHPAGITSGSDGNLWFVEDSGDKIGRITPSGSITEFPIATAGARLNGITEGPDCNLWFTEGFGQRIGRITTAGAVTEFPAMGTSRWPQDIHAGPDGNLWFAEFNGNRIGRITPSGTVTEFPIDTTVGTTGGAPWGITSGPDGNIWFTMTNSNVVGRMTPDGVTITYFPLAANSTPNGITDGPDGNLWFVDQQSGRIGQISTSGTIVTNPTPTVSSGPNEITTGPDGAVWFNEYAVNQVGRVQMPATTAPGRPGNVTAAPLSGGAKVSWTVPTFDGGSPITSYTITPYIGNTAQAATTVPAPATSAVVTGLANDSSYSFAVSASNAVLGSGPSVRSCGTVVPEPDTTVVPALSNGAYGGYSTTVYVQNTGSAPAHVFVTYFDQSGNPVGTGDVNNSLAPNALWTVPQNNGHSFPAGQAGTAIISSGQPISTFVNEFAPSGSDATSYSGVNLTGGVGPTLYVPTIVNGAYGGYTTGIGLVNLAAVPADLTITYRDGSGAIAQTQSLPGVPAGAYQAVYSGDAAIGLPPAFAGTATITSSAGNLAAVVNETGPGGQFSSFDAVPSGATKVYAPAALRNAYGGYNTGMAIQNTIATAGTVTIDYYDTSGVATTKTFPIAANGYVGVYQGNDIPVAGAYTSQITSDVAIAAIVNEVAPSTTSALQSTAYNTFSAGSASAHLPLVESAGSDGWSTGEGIMNTGTAATTVTVTYFDASTGVQTGTAQNQVLQPNAFWGLYQPLGGLPNGARATAVITTSAGGQAAVICNESSATSFMSYGGQ